MFITNEDNFSYETQKINIMHILLPLEVASVNIRQY
jgi:hypothetical protein